MCLLYDKSETEALRNKLRRKPMIFYKNYVRRGLGVLVSPYMECLLTVRRGVIRSSRTTTQLSFDERWSAEISAGLHVYRSAKHARLFSFGTGVTIRVIGSERDFVAASPRQGMAEVRDQAVFTRLRIHPVDLTRLRATKGYKL